MNTLDNSENKNKIQNLPLFIFDILMLPITLIRLGLIYYGGSRYNLEGFRVLDIISHTKKPFFNQYETDNDSEINLDYRIVIRDDSRLFPHDIKDYLTIEKPNTNKIFVGNTLNFLQDDMNISQDKITVNTNNDTNPTNPTNTYKNENILNSIKDELNSVFNN